MKMIRRRVGDGFRYFVSNLTPNDVRENITLASTGGRVEVSLRSGESCFIEATADGSPTILYPVSLLQPGNRQPSMVNGPTATTIVPSCKGIQEWSMLKDLTGNKWSLRFIESQPTIDQVTSIDGLKTWESLPVDSLSELMGTGVYETAFTLSPKDLGDGHYRIDLGDVRESARLFINDTYIGCAWCLPFTLDFDGVLREGTNTIRIEVTNLPANRIAAYDRRGIKWRKFNEINVVDINYRHTTYSDWKPVPSGLNSYVQIFRHTQ